jgi:hypothetical protein
MMPTTPRSRRPGAPSEAGSAYLFALLVLFVLTVIGLSLAVVTQSEVQIGGAEKNATRTLYQADAALRVQLASAFFNDPKARTLQLAPDFGLSGETIQDRVQASTFFPIYSGPCSLCTVNTGNEQYWAINHAVAAEARRRTASMADTDASYAEKTLAQMFAIQPMKGRSIEAFREDLTDNTIKY